MTLKYSQTRKPSVKEVRRLYQFAPWAKDRSPADIAKMIRHTDLFFSVWDKGALVGMARSTTDFTFRALLWDVIVDPAYHGNGAGTRLLKMFLGHPKLKGVEDFWLSTTDKQAFYARFGFALRSKNMMVLKRKKAA
ncbi:MAG: GNAT family N-acetyltransferase [candidate division FCPU426 bacterium]